MKARRIFGRVCAGVKRGQFLGRAGAEPAFPCGVVGRKCKARRWLEVATWPTNGRVGWRGKGGGVRPSRNRNKTTRGTPERIAASVRFRTLRGLISRWNAQRFVAGSGGFVGTAAGAWERLSRDYVDAVEGT